MGYVGTAPLSGDYRKFDDISGSFNGSTTDFTLQVGSANVTPPKETTMIISVGGILQEPVSAYTVSGSTISFTAAPASGADFFGILLGDTLDIGTPADATVTGAKLATTVLTGLSASTTVADADLILIDDGAGGTLRKMTRANFIESAALDAINIDGGAIDGAVIGANSAAAITGTTITANTSIVPDAVGGADIGSTSAEWGDVYIADDKKIKFGNGQDATIEYDEDGTDQLRIAGNTVFENQIEATLDIEIDSTPSDETVSGITATFTAGEALVRGEVCYFKAADSKMWKAVATAAATSRCVAMAAADISADAAGLFLLQGFLADNGSFPAYTIGGAIYTPEAETSGENVPEQTAPDSDGDFVQVLGWAMTANSVYFNPSNDIIEHA